MNFDWYQERTKDESSTIGGWATALGYDFGTPGTVFLGCAFGGMVFRDCFLWWGGGAWMSHQPSGAGPQHWGMTLASQVMTNAVGYALGGGVPEGGWATALGYDFGIPGCFRGVL